MTDTAIALADAHARRVRRDRVTLHALVAVLVVLVMFPFVWLLVMSFKTTNEILGSFTLWPQDFTFENYITIFTDPTWYSGYINSIAYVGLNTVISVSFALPAASSGPAMGST